MPLDPVQEQQLKERLANVESTISALTLELKEEKSDHNTTKSVYEAEKV